MGASCGCSHALFSAGSLSKIDFRLIWCRYIKVIGSFHLKLIHSLTSLRNIQLIIILTGHTLFLPFIFQIFFDLDGTSEHSMSRCGPNIRFLSFPVFSVNSFLSSHIKAHVPNRTEVLFCTHRQRARLQALLYNPQIRTLL